MHRRGAAGSLILTRSRRILFFSHTGSAVGGIGTWLDHAFERFSAQGFEPAVALVRGLQTNCPERFREYHPHLKTIEVDGRGLNREGRIRAALRCLRRTQPAVVVPMGVVDVNEAVIRWKQAGRDVRLLARAQGNLPPMLADLEQYRDSIDQVVCPGALTRRYLVDAARFEPVRVRHIPNGAERATTPRTPRPPQAPIRLGYVGRMTQMDKRILDLPRLCAELQGRGVDFSLTVAGDGPCRDELLASLGPFGDRVRYLRSQPRETLYRQVYPNLDCLLLFSASEAFGIVLAEAMMNGVVPVTSRYLGFESEALVVDRLHGLSFPVGDMAAAADAVTKLARSPEVLRAFSEQARRHVESRYTWERCLSEWSDCLKEVLSRPPRPVGAVSPPPRDGGRLDRLGVPPGMTDLLRRMRRFLLGPAVGPGGEEWPLYHRQHSAEKLEQIEEACVAIESAAGARTTAAHWSPDGVLREDRCPAC